MSEMASVSKVLALWVAVLACAPPPQPRPPEPPISPKPDAPPAEQPLPPPPCVKIVRIEVWKGERTLKAFCKRGAVREMTVALGREEIGPKRRVGDHRTPEGAYRIAAAARLSRRYHLFLPIDYPSPTDAEAALADGRLGPRDYQRIIAAHEQGVPPPDDTAIGGDLGFHGEGERWRGDSHDLDWTYGCIALPDEEIEFLSEHVEPGVAVRIHP